MLQSAALHNFNLIARFLGYSLWAWIFYFDGLHLSFAMRSLLNFIVIADLVTWLIYQVYLLPRMAVNFGAGALVNLLVIGVLLVSVKTILPQTADLQAMALMVFLAVSGIKGFYYFLIELIPGGSQ